MAASPGGAGSLVIRMGLDTADVTAGFTKAEQQAQQFAQRMARSVNISIGGRGANVIIKQLDEAGQAGRRMGEQISRGTARGSEAMKELEATGRSLKATLGTVIAAFGGREIVLAADAWANLSQRMRIVAPNANDLKIVMRDLFNIAQETRQPLAQTGDLYFRLAQATQRMGVSQDRTIKLTQSLSKALVVSGASGVAAEAAMIQFAQGLASGRFSGQEFNSVNEQANRIIVALADGLGVTTGQLRKLAEAGELKPLTIIQALESQINTINDEFKGIPDTIQGAFTRVRNEFTKFVGMTGDASGATGALIASLVLVSKHLDIIAAAAVGAGVFGIGKVFQNLGKRAKEVAAPIAANVKAFSEEAAAARLSGNAQVVLAGQQVKTAQAVTDKARATQQALAVTHQEIIATRTAALANVEKGRAYLQATGNADRYNAAVNQLAQADRAAAVLGPQILAQTQAIQKAKDLETAAYGKQAGAIVAATTVAGAAMAKLAGVGRALFVAFGGLPGLIITGLSLAATAWQLFGKSAEDAGKAVERTLDDEIADLERNNKKLAERLALIKAGQGELARSTAAEPAGKAQAQINLLRASIAAGDTGDIGAEEILSQIKAISEALGKLRDEQFVANLKLNFEDARNAQLAINTLEAELKRLKGLLASGSTLDIGTEAAERKIRALEDQLRRFKTLLGEGTELNVEISAADFKKNAEEFRRKNETKPEEFKRLLEETKRNLGPEFRPSDEARLREKVFGSGAANKAQNAAEAALRAVIEGRVKLIEDGIRQEEQSLRFREQILQDSFRDELISFGQYYEARKQVVQTNAATEIAAQREIQATLAAERDKFRKESDKQKFTNRIAESQREEVRIAQEAAAAVNRIEAERRRAQQQSQDETARTANELASLQGDTAVAAISAMQLQHRERRIQLGLQAQSIDAQERLNAEIGLRGLDALEKLTAQLAVFQQAQNDAGRIAAFADVERTRVQIALNKGRIGEIEGLQRQSDINKELIRQMQQYVETVRRVAQETNNPDMLLGLEQMLVKIEELQAETDLAADKFRDMFSDAFGSSLADFITGTKSAKEAFNDFVKSVTRQISDIASKNIADALFKGDGPLAGVGGFFGQVFGGGSKAVAGGAAGAGAQAASATSGAAGMTALATSATTASTGVAALASTAATTTAPLTLLATNAGLAAQQLGAMVTTSAFNFGGGGGGGGGLSFLSDIFGDSGTWGLFNRANGGLLGKNQPTWVGEAGPEIWVPQTAGRIIPNREVRQVSEAPRTYNIPINVQVPPNMSRQSAAQMAAELGLRIQRSISRDK